jgi:hypothetical protein
MVFSLPLRWLLDCGKVIPFKILGFPPTNPVGVSFYRTICRIIVSLPGIGTARIFSANLGRLGLLFGGIPSLQ